MEKENGLFSIQELIYELAEGNFRARANPLGDNADVDAVITGLNLLAEKLQIAFDALNTSKENLEKRVAAHSSELTRAITDLREQKLILESVLHNMGDGVVVADSQGKFLYFNPAAAQMLGVDVVEVPPQEWSEEYGMHLSDGETLYPPSELPLVKAIRGEATDQVEVVVRKGQDSQMIALSVTGRPLRDAGGNVRGGIVVFRDVTHARHMEEALRRSEGQYRELFENANDIVYTLDLQGRFTSLNRTGERLLGYTRKELQQMPIEHIAAPGSAEPLQESLASKLGKEATTSYEVDVLTKDGRVIPLDVSTRLIFEDGQPVGIQGIARDITERKRTEAELREANERLTALVDSLEDRNRAMRLLTEMGEVLQACLNVEEAYASFQQFGGKLFLDSMGGLFVYKSSKNNLESVATWGDFPAKGRERLFTSDDCWALRRGRAHIVEGSGAALICRHVTDPSPPAYFCLPMSAQGENIGVLHLRQKATSEKVGVAKAPIELEAKRELAHTVSEHLGLALANLRLRERLHQQSIRDPLTGLFNRRYLEETLERELLRSMRTKRPLSVMMLDLDHFKNFNDQFGHEAGDLVLRELGGFLEHQVRGGDVACRYGGEEFTLLLPETPLEIAKERAREIRIMAKHLKVQYLDQNLEMVTLSVGVAAYPEHGENASALLRTADQALYRAKQAGRDRVIVAD